MDWTVYAIPLIALVVWVISNLAKSNQQAKKPDAGEGPPRRPAEKPRTSTTDIDRFLEEINRRRQQQQRRQEESEPAPVQPVVIVEAPAAPPPRVKPIPRAKPVTTVKPRRQPISSPLQTAEIVIPEVLPISTAERLDLESKAMVAPDQRAPTVSAQRPTPKHILDLRRLLQSANGIRSAFVLTEVLGVPKCKRGK